MITGENQHRRTNKQGRYFFLAVLLVGFVVIVWFGLKKLLPSHPKFGPIYETAAFDVNEAATNSIAVFLRTHLPRRLVQSQMFPSRWKDQPDYLDLNGNHLEWSIGGAETGWLYFWDPEPAARHRISLWEFATCPERNFLSVTNIPAVFHSGADPRRVEIFGATSTPEAIPVFVTQILFARRTGETNCVYVLKLAAQDGNKLTVRYCIVNPINPASN
jgi:hypothetical protein